MMYYWDKAERSQMYWHKGRWVPVAARFPFAAQLLSVWDAGLELEVSHNYGIGTGFYIWKR